MSAEHDQYLMDLLSVLEKLRQERDAEGRSERARCLAIVITDLEKLIAYYEKYIVS